MKNIILVLSLMSVACGSTAEVPSEASDGNTCTAPTSTTTTGGQETTTGSMATNAPQSVSTSGFFANWQGTLTATQNDTDCPIPPVTISMELQSADDGTLSSYLFRWDWVAFPHTYFSVASGDVMSNTLVLSTEYTETETLTLSLSLRDTNTIQATVAITASPDTAGTYTCNYSGTFLTAH